MRFFQHLFKPKFELLGIKAEMNRIERENLCDTPRQPTAEPHLHYALSRRLAWFRHGLGFN
jgi:hypothetical protein